MREPKIIKLLVPIDTADGLKEEIEVKPPTGAQMMGLADINMAKPSPRDFTKLVMHCQGLPPNVVKAMDGADVMMIGQTLFNFLSTSLLIGET